MLYLFLQFSLIFISEFVCKLLFRINFFFNFISCCSGSLFVCNFSNFCYKHLFMSTRTSKRTSDFRPSVPSRNNVSFPMIFLFLLCSSPPLTKYFSFSKYLNIFFPFHLHFSSPTILLHDLHIVIQGDRFANSLSFPPFLTYFLFANFGNFGLVEILKLMFGRDFWPEYISSEGKVLSRYWRWSLSRFWSKFSVKIVKLSYGPIFVEL